jgi:hypothetical protein
MSLASSVNIPLLTPYEGQYVHTYNGGSFLTASDESLFVKKLLKIEES